jgi:hypothetical protein
MLVVYRLSDRHPASELPVERSYVRFLPTHRQVPLGDALEGPTLSRLVLAGPYVAFSLRSTYPNEPPRSTWRVGRLNASSGKRETVPAEPGAEGQRPPASPGVVALALAPTGAIAWILVGPDSDKGSYRVVDLPAGANRVRLLAKGTDVDPLSLAFGGKYFYWTQAGVPHAAPIA